MRVLRFIAIAALAFVCALAPARAEKRVALVIGNAAYRHADRLDNPINDARGMRDALAGLKFDVVYGEDLDLRAMRLKIGEFAGRVDDADVALVYFAGHGATFGGTPYVVPVDAEFSSLSEVPYELVSVETLIGELRQAKGVRIAILDACRDNAAEQSLKRSRGGAVTRGLGPMKNPAGLIIAYATQYGATAADDPASVGASGIFSWMRTATKHSPFTAALLSNIGTPGLDVTDMFRKVGREVDAATGGKQRPEISISMYEQYTLVPAVATQQNAPAVTGDAPPPAAVDEVAWSLMKDTANAELLHRFIAQFPKSPRRPEAEERLAALEQTNDEGTTVLPKTAWETTGGNAGTERIIQIKKGDTLGALLRDLGATPEEIKAIGTVFGDRARDGNLKEGQKLRVLLSPVRSTQHLQPVRVILNDDQSFEMVVALSEDNHRYVVVDPQGRIVPDAIWSPPQLRGISTAKSDRQQIAAIVPPIGESALAAGSCMSMTASPSCPAPLTLAKERGLKRGDTFQECENCPEMMVLPAGAFTMGSPENEKDRHGDEGPQHVVTIGRAFAVGKFHVTVDQFGAFVRETGYKASPRCYKLGGSLDGFWRNPGFAQEGSHPVVCINLDDANAYANWLAKKTLKSYRLLSEAEFEYAARARTSPGAYPRFWFGNEESDLCRYGNFNDRMAGNTGAPCDDGYDHTSPVGHYRPNAFGLYDMAGNAWQWTSDCYHESYDGAPADGSAWATTCGMSAWMIRGSSWNYDPWDLRVARRDWAAGAQSNVGFRLARTLNP